MRITEHRVKRKEWITKEKDICKNRSEECNDLLDKFIDDLRRYDVGGFVGYVNMDKFISCVVSFGELHNMQMDYIDFVKLQWEDFIDWAYLNCFD